MAFQPSVAEYFNKRKRPATDDLKKNCNPSKVLVIEDPTSNGESPSPTEEKVKLHESQILFANKIVYRPRPRCIGKDSSCSSQTKLKSSGTSKLSELRGKKDLKPNGSQADIRKTFLLGSKKHDARESRPIMPTEMKIMSEVDKDVHNKETKDVQNVPEELASPAKVRKPFTQTKQPSEISAESQMETEKRALAMEESSTHASRKELNLGQIRAKISRSSRLEEMKAALQRFNENKAKLSEIQARLAGSDSPKLKGFNTIDMDMPTRLLM